MVEAVDCALDPKGSSGGKEEPSNDGQEMVGASAGTAGASASAGNSGGEPKIGAVWLKVSELRVVPPAAGCIDAGGGDGLGDGATGAAASTAVGSAGCAAMGCTCSTGADATTAGFGLSTLETAGSCPTTHTNAPTATTATVVEILAMTRDGLNSRRIRSASAIGTRIGSVASASI
jgi:hypothetical protein